MTAATTTGFSDIHRDIIETQILTRLDGCSLAAVNGTSSELRSLSSRHDLWSHICESTWPSISAPSLQQLISTFPKGPRSFFSLAFSKLHLPSSSPPSTTTTTNNLPLLISAVDLFYRGEPILCKSCETETLTPWFNSSPFRIDLLDPKELIPTPIPRTSRIADIDDSYRDLVRDLELTWIVIDPNGRRAVNVSSVKPVSIERHWLTGEIQAKFATVIRWESTAPVAITIEVTCTTGEDDIDDDEIGWTGVREVAMEMEGVDGVRLNGDQCLKVLKEGLDGGRMRIQKEDDDERKEEEKQEEVRRYDEFMEMRRERRERRLREEAKRDLICVGVGVVSTVCAAAGFWMSFWR